MSKVGSVGHAKSRREDLVSLEDLCNSLRLVVHLSMFSDMYATNPSIICESPFHVPRSQIALKASTALPTIPVNQKTNADGLSMDDDADDVLVDVAAADPVDRDAVIVVALMLVLVIAPVAVAIDVLFIVILTAACLTGE